MSARIPSRRELEKRVAILERDSSRLRLLGAVNRQLIQALLHFQTQGVFWTTNGVTLSSVTRTKMGSPLGTFDDNVLNSPLSSFAVPGWDQILSNLIKTERMRQ